MVTLRRILAVLLGVLFFFLLVADLVLLQVGSSFLKPNFYAEELEKAAFYVFLMDDAAHSAVRETREIEVTGLPDGLDGNPLAALGLTNQQVVDSLNAAVPQAWVQARAEEFLGSVAPYLSGEVDEFQITLQASKRAPEVVSQTKLLLRDSELYEYLLDGLVTPAIEDALVGALPLGVEVNPSRVGASVRAVAPSPWVHAQIDAAIDEVALYALGHKDGFEVRVALSDRATIAAEELKSLLRESDAYKLLYDGVITPAVEKLLREGVALPFDILITRDETVSAIREAAPEAWMRNQVEMIIDEVALYISGEADGFSATVSLSERRRAAVEALEDLAGRKIAARIAGLSPGAEGDRVKRQLIARTDEIVEAVEPSISELFSKDVVFTEMDLRDALSEGDNLDRLDSFRELVRDGWSYTDTDFREDVGDAPTVDSARAFLSDGWTYTHLDLEEHIAGDPDNLGWVDPFRLLLDWSRNWRFPALLPLLLMLAAIGLLGDRSWRGRVAWASGAAAIAAAVTLMAFSPIFGPLADSQLAAARETAVGRIDPAANFSDTALLITTAVFDVIDDVMADFETGVVVKAVPVLVVGLLALGVSLGWRRLAALAERARRRRRHVGC